MPIAEPEKPKTPVYKSACGETEHHPEADLCEQRRMAKAAIQTMIWTKWQAIGGWLGLAAVLGTLIYTALGTRAATRAAEAAENTLEDMQDTSQRELRAYVFVESAFINNAINARPNPGELQVPISDARVTHPNEGPLAVLHLKNFGRTPAHDVVHLSAMFVREFPLVGDLPPLNRGPFTTRAMLAPENTSMRAVRRNPNVALVLRKQMPFSEGRLRSTSTGG